MVLQELCLGLLAASRSARAIATRALLRHVLSERRLLIRALLDTEFIPLDQE